MDGPAPKQLQVRPSVLGAPGRTKKGANGLPVAVMHPSATTATNAKGAGGREEEEGGAGPRAGLPHNGLLRSRSKSAGRRPQGAEEEQQELGWGRAGEGGRTIMAQRSQQQQVQRSALSMSGAQQEQLRDAQRRLEALGLGSKGGTLLPSRPSGLASRPSAAGKGFLTFEVKLAAHMLARTHASARMLPAQLACWAQA